jgi:hypothetical protein
MDNMIGYCGITCSECPAMLATVKDDDQERARVAQMWSEQFKVTLNAEDINCNGCLSTTEPLFSHCKVCEIRKCGQEKQVMNCAYCDDYDCEKLTKFLDMVPEARSKLEKIRQTL